MGFNETLRDFRLLPLKSIGIEILQVNLGYRCNMACKHCHVQAGSAREEMMARGTVEQVIAVLKESRIKTLDLTGGAPELSPHFRYLIRTARELGCHVMVRSNLTILFEEGMEDLADFLRQAEVEIIASLPSYREDGVDRVRGKETFRKSIQALKILNRLGFGTHSTTLKLNLVYNPQGAFLPPAQSAIEEEYKRALGGNFGITFDRLYTFVNMPIGRFREFLIRTNAFEKYMERLTSAFNRETINGIMCRHLLNIGWDGRVYDCDFNQMMGLPVQRNYPQHIKDFEYELLQRREITFGDHCFGCSAGQGST
ncbi:MAG TPA: radical SAM protein [Nitrospiraceae bacterium]|jgi:radical SAM/Cys-rich protein|nr:radical SAM protein [Nitrospiraceae bacterium]